MCNRNKCKQECCSRNSIACPRTTCCEEPGSKCKPDRKWCLHRIPRDPTWYALWAFLAAFLILASMLDDVTSGETLSLWVIYTHMEGFTFMAIVISCVKSPKWWVAGTASTLWVLSTFVIGGVVIIASNSMSLVDSALNTSDGLGSDLMMQMLEHVAPLIALATIIGVPTHTQPWIAPAMAAMYIYIWLMDNVIWDINFLTLYNQPQTGPTWWVPIIFMFIWFLVAVLVWEYFFYVFRDPVRESIHEAQLKQYYSKSIYQHKAKQERILLEKTRQVQSQALRQHQFDQAQAKLQQKQRLQQEQKRRQTVPLRRVKVVDDWPEYKATTRDSDVDIDIVDDDDNDDD